MDIFKLAFIVLSAELNASSMDSQSPPLSSPTFTSASKQEAFSLFPKRKKKQKQKRGSKMKKHNRSMGKKFKRKNDDSLRDRMQ
jgi:hypothetical protein